MIDQDLQLNPQLNVIPSEVKKIYLMGICGTAMAALAGMLQQRGYQVSGSDAHVYPPMSDFLAELNITIYSGYTEENLSKQIDLVIVGNVISRSNPEVGKLCELEIPYASLPQALSHFFISSRTSLVVTGTHGKTTTSSMLSAALDTAGEDPSFMIGGIVHRFNSNHRLGSGKYFVTEGDEYDTAFFDKVSKFLHYQPDVAIITSVEFDHADIFNNLDEIKTAFKKFVALLPPEGLIVAHTADPNVREVIEHSRCNIISYGLHQEADWLITDLVTGPAGASFQLTASTGFDNRIQLPVSGIHNCLNAAAVAAVLDYLSIDHTLIGTGLSDFPGVKRRQEVRGIINGISVIDDFAHHPTAVNLTLEGLKQAHSDGRLIAIFEPRTNTSRRSFFQEQYARSFGSADLVIIKQPSFRQEMDGDDRFSVSQLAAQLNQQEIPAHTFETTDEIIDSVREFASPGDLIAVLSNGGFENIHQRLLDMLRLTHGME